jgi:hypothetical protein
LRLFYLSANKSSESRWERNSFWGSLSLGIGIVLTVVAAMKHDIRWLLILAGPFFLLALWALVKQLKGYWTKIVIMAVGAIAISGGLYCLNVWVSPPPILTDKTSAPNPPLPAAAPPANPMSRVTRSHVHIIAVDFTSSDRKDVLRSRAHFQNDGDAPIIELRNCELLAVAQYSTDPKAQMEIEDGLFQQLKNGLKKCPLVPNQVPAHSTILNSDEHGEHVLTDELYEEEKNGVSAIYFVGRIRYRHDDKLRYSDYCYWTKGDVSGMKLCFKYNQEP